MSPKMFTRRIFQQNYAPINTKSFQLHRFITTILAISVAITLLWNGQLIINNFRTRPIDIHGLPSYPQNLPRAQQISANELINRNWTSDRTDVITRIIHQSWENADIPTKWATWSDSWRVKHPDWEWVLWTNEDNRALVEARAPWFLETYDALPGEIRRADVMRNFYMFFFGG
jgi:mannosyltransferase OCH1-like enzyme